MKTYSAIILALAVMLASACNNKKDQILPVRGTMNGPLREERAPQKVHLAMTLDYTDRYENILDDKENGVSVWSLVWCNPNISSEGYGIQVTKDNKTTSFPNLYHGKNPRAEYDAGNGTLWVFCGVMEGTGVHVEKPWLFRFDETGSAITETKIDPYTIQEILCNRLGYRIKDNEITLYDKGETLCSVTSTVTDMGGFDKDDPVWIGEQLSYYTQEGNLYIQITPGVKFTTGLFLLYDDMPTLTAPVKLGANGSLQIGDISVGL